MSVGPRAPSKLQIPSSKHHRNTKLQGPVSLRSASLPVGGARIPWLLELDVWCFSGAWCLVLGAFNAGQTNNRFELSKAHKLYQSESEGMTNDEIRKKPEFRKKP